MVVKASLKKNISVVLIFTNIYYIFKVFVSWALFGLCVGFWVSRLYSMYHSNVKYSGQIYDKVLFDYLIN